MEKAWWREPTKGQWSSFLAAWLGWVLDAFDFTVFLLVMPAISREFGVATKYTAGTITLTLLFRLAGGWVAGSVADRWGRKLPLMISLIWFAVCDGAVAFAPSFTWVLILRSLFGFGMGAEWTAGATLAMENWPARSRSIASGILQGSWAIGYLLAAVVMAWVVPHWGWRGLFIVAALPALAVFPIYLFVPESPEWEAGRKQKDAVASKATGASGALASSFWSRKLLNKIAWASVVMALGFSAYYALTGLYPTMLDIELHHTTTEIARLVAWFNVGMLLGAVACGAAAARIGIGRAVALSAALALAVLPAYVGRSGPLWLGAFLGGVFGAGFSGVVPAFLTGLFEAKERARAVGIVYHVGAFAAAFVPMLIAGLAPRVGSLAITIGLVTAACQLALIPFMLSRRARGVQTGGDSANVEDQRENALVQHA